MAFFKKEKEKENSQIDVQGEAEIRKTRPKSDKDIKRSAPKRSAGKKFIRILFWSFMMFICLKGIVAFVQGPRLVQNVTNISTGGEVISDSIKGFAVDFSTEYFTWTADHSSDRTVRLSKFIDGIDPDAGLKAFDVVGPSTVTSSEVYDSKQIDDNYYEITVLVRRIVQVQPISLRDPNSEGSTVEGIDTNELTVPKDFPKKTYMVVPVTVTDKGPVIQTYPRFISEQQRGELSGTAVEPVIEEVLRTKALELAESFLRAWFDGNASQLKYFYADGIEPPASVTKSEFSIDKVERVTLYRVQDEKEAEKKLRIVTAVLVKSDLQESFINTWVFYATEKDGRLYVHSVDQEDFQSKSETDNYTSSPTLEDGTASNNEVLNENEGN